MIFSIRPMAADDAPFVSGIMQRRWKVPGSWSDRESARFLAGDRTAAGFVARADGRTVGVGLFDIRNDDVSEKYGPWFYLLWVEPEYRGHSIGIGLTRARMDHARKFGYEKVFLDTSDAPEYHLAMGWKPVETVMFEGKETLIMSYDLKDPFPLPD